MLIEENGILMMKIVDKRTNQTEYERIKNILDKKTENGSHRSIYAKQVGTPKSPTMRDVKRLAHLEEKKRRR